MLRVSTLACYSITSALTSLQSIRGTIGEKVREQNLRMDPLVGFLSPQLVKCRLCKRDVKLSLKSCWDPEHWRKHRERCIKNASPAKVQEVIDSAIVVCPFCQAYLLKMHSNVAFRTQHLHLLLHPQPLSQPQPPSTLPQGQGHCHYSRPPLLRLMLMMICPHFQLRLKLQLVVPLPLLLFHSLLHLLFATTSRGTSHLVPTF